jgi:hypothetical protein
MIGIDFSADIETGQKPAAGDILGKLLDRDACLGLAHVLLAEHELVEGDVAPGV